MIRAFSLFLICLLAAPDGYATVRIALIGKTRNDSFYVASFGGCYQFADSHPDVTCLYDGPEDFQDPRAQATIVKRINDEGTDGLLISTSDSAHLVETALREAREKSIPVLTFDSDLLPEHREYRLAYVGTDNIDWRMSEQTTLISARLWENTRGSFSAGMG